VIKIKTAAEVERMRAAGHVVAELLRRLETMAQPGVNLKDLDTESERFIRSHRGEPLFKGYRGYPCTICASINETVVHGIPNGRVVQSGDILSIDVGASLDGYAGDAARTFMIGDVPADARRLVTVCRTALEKAISVIRSGVRLSQLSRTIQQYVESQGCSVVRTYTGHGIGRTMHEEPQIPNFVSPEFRASDPVLRTGMTLAIEPMVNAGTHKVKVLEDGWTVVTEDGSLSAHFEDTVAVTDRGADILTR
jgi:methionyl aminopeptidase